MHDLVLGCASEFIEGGAEWLDQFDFKRAEWIATEEIVPGLASRLSDMVWRIPFRTAAGGTEYLYVVVLMEFQSQVDRFTALRLQSAMARVTEAHAVERALSGYGLRSSSTLANSFSPEECSEARARFAQSGQPSMGLPVSP